VAEVVAVAALVGIAAPGDHVQRKPAARELVEGGELARRDRRRDEARPMREQDSESLRVGEDVGRHHEAVGGVRVVADQDAIEAGLLVHARELARVRHVDQGPFGGVRLRGGARGDHADELDGNPLPPSRVGRRGPCASDSMVRRPARYGLRVIDLRAVEEGMLGRGESLAREDALRIAGLPADRVPELCAFAHRVRLAFCGSEVSVESIVSAKTGGCSEDCAFCSQSARFPTPVRAAWLDVGGMVEAARRSQAAGATEFCIVVAVRGPDERLLARTLEATVAIKRATGMQVACSLGLLDEGQARRLAGGGIDRYNHNLEAARSFFPQICTSHSFDDRYQTCLRARAAGMELCSGGVVGMGETWAQRVELAYDLASLDPDEVPLNFLNPRPGTPLEGRDLVAPLEALKAIALFRLVLPRATLRYAGGREVTLRELQALGLV
jgi:biotin synthase